MSYDLFDKPPDDDEQPDDEQPEDQSPDQLPGEAHARNGDMDTAHDAAASVNASKLERIVLSWLSAKGPSTTSEIALGNSRRDGSITPRMRPLVKRGFVCEVFLNQEPPLRRLKRPSVFTGTDQAVWAITTRGRDILQRLQMDDSQ